MTRAEQNALLLNSITEQLKDLPNAQDIITSKFSEWFRNLVTEGQELMMQGQVAAPAGGGGGEAGGGAPPAEGG